MKTFLRAASTLFVAVAFLTTIGCAATSTRESTGEYIDDAAITAKVKASIFDRPTLKVSAIHVETHRGAVRLWGTVSSQAAIDEAARVARSVPGVKSVKNELGRM